MRQHVGVKVRYLSLGESYSSACGDELVNVLVIVMEMRR